MSEPPKRYSLSTSSSSKPAAPAAPAKAAAPVNTSTFLTRIANQAVREGAGGPAPQQGSPRFINSSIDHSSPAANLSSRLRWVETAFKTEGGQSAPAPVQQQRTAQTQAPTQAMIVQAQDFKAAVDLMRKRLQNIHLEMEVLDKELTEIQAKMANVPVPPAQE